MSKQKNKSEDNKPAAAAENHVVTETVSGSCEHKETKVVIIPLEEKPASEGKIVYAFPTQSRCPWCGTTDTVAYSTKDNVQYRRCLRAVCRRNYTVIGQKI